MPDLTDRMRAVLTVLATSERPMVPNHIGRALGFLTGQRPHQSNHAGRVMGPAQHVIFALTRLRELGLAAMTDRPDGLAGTAYAITPAGRKELSALEVSR